MISLGSFDLGAMSGPKRCEWVNMKLDTGAAVNTFPLNFRSRLCRRWQRTASDECIPDGGTWQSQGCDENGLC